MEALETKTGQPRHWVGGHGSPWEDQRPADGARRSTEQDSWERFVPDGQGIVTTNGLIPPKDGSSPSAAHPAAIEAIGSTRGFIDARPAPAFGNVKTSTIGRDVRPPRLLCLVPVAGGTAVRKNPADLSAPVSNRKSGTTHLPHDRADPASRQRRPTRERAPATGGRRVPVTTGRTRSSATTQRCRASWPTRR